MKSSIPPEELESIEERLFESLAGDEPPKRAHRTVAVALGLSATLTTATITGATAGAAAAGAGGAGAGAGAGVSGVAAKAGLAAKASTMLLIKWVGVGTLAGAVSVGAVGYAHRTWQNALKPVATHGLGAKEPANARTMQAPVAAAAAPIAESVTPIAEPMAPIAEPVVPIAEPVAPVPRVTLGRTAAPAPASRGSVAKEPTAKEPAAKESVAKEPVREPIDDTSNLRSHSASMLAAEVAALDDVRRAITARDGDRALALLRRHTHDFPSATLNIEATVLRIEALLLSGSMQAARDLGRDFLASYPASTHATRVRRLLADYEKP